MSGISAGALRAQTDRGRWLRRLIWVRVSVFTFFITAYFLTAEASPERLVDLSVILAAVYALSFCWYALLRINRSYLAQAYAQIVVDLLLITWIVNRTGGIDSYFSSLYFLEIMMSSILLPRRGAYYTAAVSSLVHGVHLDLAHFLVIPSTTSFPSLMTLQSSVAMTVFGFCTVGYLTNYLAERWRVSDEALEESTGQVAFLQALTSHIIDSLGSGLITTDLEGTVYVFNPAAGRITGRRSDDAVGRNIREIFPALPRETGVGSFELEAVGGEGGRSVLGLRFTVTQLRIGSREIAGYVWSFEDVTEMRRMEKELRKSERMAAIGVMSAGIAHEIRNPLASITGSFNLLKSDLSLTAEQAQLSGIIARETERLNLTINDFLTYARPAAPRFARVDLAQMVADAVRLIRNSPSLGPGHAIETDLAPADAVVDENMIRQVIHNLASNAFKAMPEAGVLQITLRADAGKVRLAFRDDGVGMTEPQLDRLFLPFHSSFRTGTGLGLSIVYQIVSSHDGAISVDSAPGQGATFTIELPRERAADPPRAPAEAGRPVGPSRVELEV